MGNMFIVCRNFAPLVSEVLGVRVSIPREERSLGRNHFLWHDPVHFVDLEVSLKENSGQVQLEQVRCDLPHDPIIGRFQVLRVRFKAGFEFTSELFHLQMILNGDIKRTKLPAQQLGASESRCE